MVINKGSWHYRLIAKARGEYWMPNTLCQYIGVLVVLLFLGFLGISAVAGMPLLYMMKFEEVAFRAFIDGLGPVVRWFFAYLTLCGIVGLVAIAISAFLGVLTGCAYLSDKFGSEEPGIVTNMYRAWKEKYCPIIEYKD